jgi:hypothetical protein
MSRPEQFADFHLGSLENRPHRHVHIALGVAANINDPKPQTPLFHFADPPFISPEYMAWAIRMQSQSRPQQPAQLLVLSQRKFW